MRKIQTKDIWLIRYHEGIENLVAFFTCPEDLCEFEIKSIALISVVEGISKEKRTQAVTWISFTNPQVCGNKRQNI